MAWNAILTWVIIGGVAGLLAQWLVGGVGGGYIGTVLIGIVGAFIGAWLFRVLGVALGPGIVIEIITASVGAAALLVTIRILMGN